MYFDSTIRGTQSYGGFYLEQAHPVIQEAVVYRFGPLSINDAELSAVLAGLRYAEAFNVRRIQIFGDNTTAIDVLNEVFVQKGSRYLNRPRCVDWWSAKKIARLITSFESLNAFHMNREANWLAHNIVDSELVDKGEDLNAIPYWRIDS